MCSVCGVKKYVVSEREDGLFAVERCDECSRFSGVQFDEDAAELARQDGIECSMTYPCYIELEPSIIDRYTILRENPHDVRKLFYMVYQIDWVTSRGYSMKNYSEDHGFNGELWVCFEEFCQHELINKAFMQSILHGKDFEKWLNWKLGQKIDMKPSSIFTGKRD